MLALEGPLRSHSRIFCCSCFTYESEETPADFSTSQLSCCTAYLCKNRKHAFVRVPLAATWPCTCDLAKRDQTAAGPAVINGLRQEKDMLVLEPPKARAIALSTDSKCTHIHLL